MRNDAVTVNRGAEGDIPVELGLGELTARRCVPEDLLERSGP